jgi:hydroxymethylglutaryl-CoA reductase
MAAQSLGMLGNPSAAELMQIAASVGLASNFSAIRALVSTGIQHGHMKFHLNNILLSLNATPEEQTLAKRHFDGKTISYRAVKEFLK